MWPADVATDALPTSSGSTPPCCVNRASSVLCMTTLLIEDTKMITLGSAGPPWPPPLLCALRTPEAKHWYKRADSVTSLSTTDEEEILV